MKKNAQKTISLFLSLLLCISCFAGEISYASKNDADGFQAGNTEFAKETAEIIKNENNPSDMLRIIGKTKANPPHSAFYGEENSVFAEDGRFMLQFSSEEKLLECLEELNKNPDIIYAERDCAVYTGTLEDREEFLSWGVGAIEADIYSSALAASSDDNSVTVAVIDSGSQDIDFLKDRLVEGYDFYENDSDAFQDESTDSHGTFLAGIIADCTRDISVKIMPVRVLKSRSGSLINAVNGIYYAVDNGADVINISLGAELHDCSSLEDAIAYAESKNVTVVVCAGNLGIDIENFCPAHIESVIAVSSVNSDFVFSEDFSNFGNGIDLAAPGEKIKGYDADGETVTMSGTSMSAAFVSAAAAMFRLDNPACNTNQVRTALFSCAEDLGNAGYDEYYGYGITKLGALAYSDTKYVEGIRFSEDTYALYEGGTLEINPVFAPSDVTDNFFTLSSDNENISINGNIITAISQGTAIVTVTSSDGGYTDTAEITISKAPVLKIKNNTGEATINYGETLCLTAEITDRPENATVWWYVDGVKSGEDETFEISLSGGSVKVTAKLIGTDGVPVTDSQENEISDSQTVTVKAGLWQKIISFFKNLFRINRTVVQAVFK